MKFFDFIVRWGERNWERNRGYYEGIASYYKQIIPSDVGKTQVKQQNKTDSYKASSMICSTETRAIHHGGR